MESTELSDRNHMKRMMTTEEAGQEQKEQPFREEGELLQLVVVEGVQLRTEVHYHMHHRGNYLDNHY